MKSHIISYIEQDQRKWDNNLARVACALRTARHEATKQTPFYLNFAYAMVDYGSHHAKRRDREDFDDAPSGKDEQNAQERNPEGDLG
jgi:hypothetical protein